MKIAYRPEIDGLRAIAVGVVILYHAQITILGHQPFKGGFIGVDIFFVISGYLITSIILKELITTGSFSFKHFYERRVRRILPALLFVMLVSFPFAWMYLLPSSFVDFSKSILYSLGFSSNFYFHYSDHQYGAESGLLKPFLHTWSLSVEEQYYILFPIVLLVTFKYFRKFLIYVLIFGFITSLVLAEWTSKNHPSASFYFLHTRIWELLAGSILAYIEIINGYRSKQTRLNLILPTIGLLLIGHSILFFDDKMFHPSFYTLSPIIGVCLIIWFSDKNEPISKILSLKLFVSIGLISYSLYLWHYPIFAFAKVTGLVIGSTIGKMLLIPIVFICSVISYHFIEKPFRQQKYQLKKILIILLSSIILLASFNFYIIYKDGIQKRIFKNNLIFFFKTKETNINLFKKDNTKKVVMIGDSHAGALEFNLNEEIKKKNLSLYYFHTQMYLKDFNRIQRKNKKIDEEYNFKNNTIHNFLKKNSDLIVILHHRWTYLLSETSFDNEEGYKEVRNPNDDRYLEPINIKTSSLEERQKYIKAGLILQINDIISQGHKLILVYPVPEMGFNPPQLLHNKYLFEKELFENSTPILSGNYEVYKKRNRLIFEILDSIESPNIYRVYPHKLFCDKKFLNRCVANDNNHIFYYDNNHLSIEGSKFVVDKIMKEIEKIEFKSN
jgi:peptidoglycan/LPS O-acetylase OafA/YrhL